MQNIFIYLSSRVPLDWNVTRSADVRTGARATPSRGVAVAHPASWVNFVKMGAHQVDNLLRQFNIYLNIN